MTQEKLEQTSDEIKRDIVGLKQKVLTYDWNYRLSRFDEKINAKKEEALTILDNIKLSDNNKYSENSSRKECQRT